MRYAGELSISYEKERNVLNWQWTPAAAPRANGGRSWKTERLPRKLSYYVNMTRRLFKGQVSKAAPDRVSKLMGDFLYHLVPENMSLEECGVVDGNDLIWVSANPGWIPVELLSIRKGMPKGKVGVPLGVRYALMFKERDTPNRRDCDLPSDLCGSVTVMDELLLHAANARDKHCETIAAHLRALFGKAYVVKNQKTGSRESAGGILDAKELAYRLVHGSFGFCYHLGHGSVKRRGGVLDVAGGVLKHEDLQDALLEPGTKTPTGGFVYLNACNSAVPYRNGTIARELLRVGRTAVLGTIYPILGQEAANFAAKFCGRLVTQSLDLSQVLHDTISENWKALGEGNFCWACYRLYGNPMRRFLWTSRSDENGRFWLRFGNRNLFLGSMESDDAVEEPAITMRELLEVAKTYDDLNAKQQKEPEITAELIRHLARLWGNYPIRFRAIMSQISEDAEFQDVRGILICGQVDGGRARDDSGNLKERDGDTDQSSLHGEAPTSVPHWPLEHDAMKRIQAMIATGDPVPAETFGPIGGTPADWSAIDNLPPIPEWSVSAGSPPHSDPTPKQRLGATENLRPVLEIVEQSLEKKVKLDVSDIDQVVASLALMELHKQRPEFPKVLPVSARVGELVGFGKINRLPDVATKGWNWGSEIETIVNHLCWKRRVFIKVPFDPGDLVDRALKSVPQPLDAIAVCVWALARFRRAPVAAVPLTRRWWVHLNARETMIDGLFTWVRSTFGGQKRPTGTHARAARALLKELEKLGLALVRAPEQWWERDKILPAALRGLELIESNRLPALIVAGPTAMREPALMANLRDLCGTPITLRAERADFEAFAMQWEELRCGRTLTDRQAKEVRKIVRFATEFPPEQEFTILTQCLGRAHAQGSGSDPPLAPPAVDSAIAEIGRRWPRGG